MLDEDDEVNDNLSALQTKKKSAN